MKKTCSVCGQLKEMLSWETLCYSCAKNKELMRIQQEIADAVNTGESVDTYSSDYAICPYCGYPMEQESYEDTPEMYEEGWHDVECPDCGRAFKLLTNISYSWETEKAADRSTSSVSGDEEI